MTHPALPTSPPEAIDTSGMPSRVLAIHPDAAAEIVRLVNRGRALNGCVVDLDSHAEALATATKLAETLDALDENRKAVKRVPLDVCRRVDDAVRPYVAAMEAVRGDLLRDGLAFEREAQRKADEAAAERQRIELEAQRKAEAAERERQAEAQRIRDAAAREAAALEAKRAAEVEAQRMEARTAADREAAEVAAAKAAAEVAEVRARADAAVEALPVVEVLPTKLPTIPQAPKPGVRASKGKPVLVITDAAAIPMEVAGVVVRKPDEDALIKLLVAEVPIAGCHLEYPEVLGGKRKGGR